MLVLGVQSFLIPRPSVIAESLGVGRRRRSCKGVLFTGAEAVGGLIIGVVLGTVAGLATARWASAREVLLPVAIGASTIPIIAFAPITLNWFGPESLLPRMTIVAVMVFFPVMVNTIRGLTNVEPAALELMLVVRGERLADAGQAARARTRCRTGSRRLRIATTLSVIGAVVGEFFGGPLYSLGIYITLETGPQPLPVGVGRDRARLRARDRAVPRGGRPRAAGHALARGARDGRDDGPPVAYHRPRGEDMRSVGSRRPPTT